MAEIKKHWKRLNLPQFVLWVKGLLAKLGETPVIIPNAAAIKTDLQPLYDALETAMNQVKALEEQLDTAREARDVAADALMDGVDAAAKDCASGSKGDPVKLTALTFAIVGAHEAVGPMPQPTSFELTTSENEGCLDGDCDAVDGAKYFEIQTATNPNEPATFRPLVTVPSSKFSLTGLPSGTRIWGRIRAVGAAGPGPWSDWSGTMVPYRNHRRTTPRRAWMPAGAALDCRKRGRIKT